VRLRVLQAILAVLVVYAVYSTVNRPQAVEPPPRRPRNPPRVATVPGAAAAVDGSVPVRNLFEYGALPPPPVLSYVAPMKAVETPLPAERPSPAPVKLVGLVRQGDGLRAALAVEGEIVLGDRGQTVNGYTIVSIDEDRGVVLDGPDGKTLELRP